MYKMVDITGELEDEVLAEDVISESGTLLLNAGTVLTNRHIATLLNRIPGKKVKILIKDESEESEQASFLEQNEINLKTIYDESLLKLKEKLSIIHDDRIPDMGEIKEIYSSLLEQIFSNQHMSSLFNVMQRTSKEYLYEHSLNVAIVSTLIGRLLGRSREELHEIAEMGFFHDIGMLSVPDKILSKPTKLDEKEIEIVRKHISKGAQILQKMGEKRENIIKASLFHHERINGSGYSRKLLGSQIPFLIQIITVADIFTAMTSARPYRQAFSQLQVCHELMKETIEGYHNPAIIVPFVRYIMRQHLWEKIKLSNGEQAEIIFIHENEPHQPIVRLEDKTYMDLRKEKLTFLGNTLPLNRR